MKTVFALLMISLASVANAQSRNPLDTTDQARQRQSAENYETYRKHGNEAPLGGYNRPLGDPPVSGVERPGYVTPPPVYQSSQPNSSRDDWRDRLRR